VYAKVLYNPSKLNETLAVVVASIIPTIDVAITLKKITVKNAESKLEP
jgi:hypothetical protein